MAALKPAIRQDPEYPRRPSLDGRFCIDATQQSMDQCRDGLMQRYADEPPARCAKAKFGFARVLALDCARMESPLPRLKRDSFLDTVLLLAASRRLEAIVALFPAIISRLFSMAPKPVVSRPLTTTSD